VCKLNTSKSKACFIHSSNYVLTCYSTDVNFIASQALARSQQQPEQIAMEEGDNGGEKQADAMAALERQARAPLGFVAASSGPEGGNSKHAQPVPAVSANPDALDVDLDDD